MIRQTLTNPSNDARYQGIVKVQYAFHGLFGKTGKVIRKVRYGGVAFLEIDVDGVRHTVHEWMTSESGCQCLTFGYDPVSSFDALRAVLELLDRPM